LNVLYGFRTSGITIPYEENYVYPYADSTYSYIFIRDINDYATDQGWTDDRRYLKEWIVFAHELGHQRAGLTHPDGDTSSYYCPYCHNVVWDSSYCIMSNSAENFALNGYSIGFCKPDIVPEFLIADTTTCMQNFIRQLYIQK